MAGVKISNLPALPSAALTDLIAEVQPASGGTTYRATLQQVVTLFSGTIVTPQNGGIVYTDATSLQVLTPTATANQVLMSGANSAPHWSTPTYPTASGTAGKIIRSNGTNNLYTTMTYPDTIALNSLLFANVANNLGPITPAASSALISSAGSVPSWSTVLPALTTADPIVDQGLATKKYVDDTSQGRQLKDPVEAATTGAFTATYANGSAGVGATLTGTVMAAFAPDGITLAVGDRVLFKDQASSFQNGIYTTTVLGTGAVLPVFTRSTDMDTPSQFQYATTFVIGGTVNAGRTYTETLAVVTIGTDPVTFVQTGDATGITSISAADTTVTLTPNPIVATGTIAVNTATFVRAVKVQVISATATYTPSAGLLYAVVKGCGPGGGSGGAAGAAVTGSASAGGGGGGTFIKTFTAANIGASAACVVGTGGAGGAAGNNAGSSGSGATTFTPAGTGGVLTGNVGTGGGGSAASANASMSGNGGTGGTATGGDENIVGCDGQPGISIGFTLGGIAGFGGNSYLSTVNVNTQSGTGSAVTGVLGAGGSGANAYGSADAAGAAGGNGIIIVTEYCNTP